MIAVERRVVSVLAVVLPFVGGCGLLPESPVCLAIISPAITLDIRDSVTNAALSNAVAIARDGAYTDTAQISQMPRPDTVYDVALGRSGAYAVVVSHTGYRQWQRDAVRVRRGDCGPETVRLDVRMQPSTP
ncbi:MAG TPA: hypothetical protein VGE27_12450 [Gemmatimonas sp.]|uniref:hypothetical protein n=1 Tax=Gemmatimonas sp. TaxID=1962908 RepID=UPI002EDB35D5